MAKDIITLVLNGEIQIKDFVTAVSSLQDLIQALTKELKIDDSIKWIIHDLEISSSIASIRGEADEIQKVERVVDAYGEVGKSLERGMRPNYSDRVVSAADRIVKLLDTNITSVKFETSDTDALIQSRTNILIDDMGITKAYGIIEGRVQTLTNRKGLRFTLFDTLRDKAISCYLKEGQEELIREAWGKRAIIQGEITREILSGRPLTIRNITLIKILSEVKSGDYLKVRGIIPVTDEKFRPELVIRRLRDDN